MRAVIQRVTHCTITVEGESVGSISGGLLVYLGVSQSDGEADARYVADKTAGLRIFEDSDGVMNLSAEDVEAEICVVSQFTLYGDTRKGRRPSYSHAAPPERATPLYEKVVEHLRARGFRVATGRFGAHMSVDYVNDGPVTILVDSNKLI
jgi:D-tyrosyl-tRNA(Tyr) deacylase